MNEFFYYWSAILLHSLWVAAIFYISFKVIEWLPLSAAIKRIIKIFSLGVFLLSLGGIYISLVNSSSITFIDTNSPNAFTEGIVSDFSKENFKSLVSSPSLSYVVFYTWLLGMLAGTISTFLGWKNLYQIKNTALPIYSSNIQAVIDKKIEKAKLKRKVKVLCSSLIDSPMTVGAIKPIIYFPLGILSGLSIAEIELIVEHELAHIKRHDYIVNIGLLIIEKMFFFNPFVWQLTKSIRKEMEFTCDDEVLKKHKEISYAKLLYQLQIIKINNALPVHFANSKNELSQRINRILRQKTPSSKLGLASVSSIFVLLFIASFTFIKEDKITPHNKAKIELASSVISQVEHQDTLKKKNKDKVKKVVVSTVYSKIEPFLARVKSELIKDGLLSAERPRILLMFQFSDVLHGEKVLGKYYKKYKDMLNETFPVYDSFATTRLFVYKAEDDKE